MENILPILYSFRRCPFAMRARMAIYLSSIPCELREIKLSSKPIDMISISPKATVPILQLPDGMVIDESIDIVFWSFNHNKSSPIIEEYNNNKIDIDNLISNNDNSFKYHLDRYKYVNRYDNVDPQYHRGECIETLKFLDKLLEKNQYLFSKDLGIADICIFPFVRQFRIADIEWFDNNLNMYNFKKWFLRILNSELFEKIMFKYELWEKNGKKIIFPKNL